MSSSEHHAYNSASGNTFVLTVSTIGEHICKVTFPCICYSFISMLAAQNFQVEVNEASLRCSLSIKKAKDDKLKFISVCISKHFSRVYIKSQTPVNPTSHMK